MKTARHLNFHALFLLLPLLLGSCEEDDDLLPPPRHFEAGIEIDGAKRSYIVNLPPGYYDDEITTYALVIGLHGTGGSASQFENHYGFSHKADEAGFIAVYPNGLSSTGPWGARSWNAGSCCEFAMRNNVNDVKFISTLIDYLTGNYRINTKRVYVTGMSNGGMLAYRLAAELPNKIAAIAPVSSNMVYNPPPTQSRPVPILHLHSIHDPIVPYTGGTNPFGYYFSPVDSVLRVWALRNSCNPDPIVLTDNAQYKQLQWTNDQGNEMITHYVTQDGGHSWPMAPYSRPGNPPSYAIDANLLIWEFFSRHQLE